MQVASAFNATCQIIVTCKPGDFGNILLEIIISQLILTLTVGSFYCKCLYVINSYNCIFVNWTLPVAPGNPSSPLFPGIPGIPGSPF